MNHKLSTGVLAKSEIHKLKDFAPVDWNYELDKFIRVHYGKKYFLPIVTVKNGEIIAFANAIINENVG